MLVEPNDQFHLGLVVDDFEGTRQRLSDTLGYVWGPEARLELVLHLPDGPITFQHRLQYTVAEPRLELIQSVPGTPLEPSSSTLHHLGYWCADVDATSQA